MKLKATTLIDFHDFDDLDSLTSYIHNRLDKTFLANDIKDFEDIENYFYINTSEEEKFVKDLTQEEINAITEEDIDIYNITFENDRLCIYYSCNFRKPKEYINQQDYDQLLHTLNTIKNDFENNIPVKIHPSDQKIELLNTAIQIVNNAKNVFEIIKKRDIEFDGQEFGATYSQLDNIIEEIRTAIQAP